MNKAASFFSRLACATCAVFAWGSVLRWHPLVTILLLAGAVAMYQLDKSITGR